MAQEIIWAGSSSFSSGDTPWGLYDTDNDFSLRSMESAEGGGGAGCSGTACN